MIKENENGKDKKRESEKKKKEIKPSKQTEEGE